MSMYIEPGQTKLLAYRVVDLNNDLADADSGTLELRILGPTGTVIATIAAGSLIHDGTGLYHYTWTAPSDATPGDTWGARWYGEVDGATLIPDTEDILIVPAGSLSDLLTAADLAVFGVGTSLSESALQLLLDATAVQVNRVAGDSDMVTEEIPGDTTTVMLTGEAHAITAVIERNGSVDRTLAANDYALSPTKIAVRRLATGTNPRTTWDHEVVVTYARVSDVALRKAAQLALIRLELNRNPGLTSESIGAWSQAFAAPGQVDLERAAILESARPAQHLVFFG